MRVILLQDVRKVGKKWEVKDVSDGYGKNFLIARGMAKLATADEIKKIAEHKKSSTKKAEKQKTLLEALAAELERHPLEFEVKTGKGGKLYASIGGKEIEAEFKKRGVEIKIELEKPFKTVGEHHVELDLGLGKKKKIGVRIVAGG